MNAITRIRWMLRTARLLRLLAHLLSNWKLLAIIAYALLDDVPHIRLQDKPSYQSCVYLGNRGLIHHDGLYAIGCPLLMMMSPANQRKFYE